MTTARDPRLARLDRRSPGAARLAELASLAVRVDTGLLRRLRQELSPDTDVGAESELWFSGIVESRSQTGFQIAPAVLEELRERLTKLPGRPAVSSIRSVLSRAHAGTSPAIELEEAINGIALEQGVAGQPAIDEALRPALGALASGGADAIDIARWAALAAPRLHTVVRETANARTLMLSAALLLRGRARLGGDSTKPDTRISELGWALSATVTAQRIGVEFVPGGLQFRAALEGVGQVDVPRTDPLIVDLEWQDGTFVRRRLTQAGPGVLVALEGDPTEVTITTLRGDQYRVRATAGAGSNVSGRPSFPASSLLDACVQVVPLGREEPLGVVFAIGDLLLGLRRVLEPYPLVAIRGTPRQLEVVSRPAAGLVVSLRPLDGRGLDASLKLAASTQPAVRAAAAGFPDDQPRWYDVAIEPDPSDGRTGLRRGALFHPPRLSERELAAAFVGAPIVSDHDVMGMLSGITPARPGEEYAAIEVLDAHHVAEAFRHAPRQSARRFRVFISSARADALAARRIRETLAWAGSFEVFLDVTNIEAGQDWPAELEKQIMSSDLVLAVVSEQSAKSEWVQREWQLAIDRASRTPSSFHLVPVGIDDEASLHVAVPPFMQRLRRIHAPGGDIPPTAVDALRRQLEKEGPSRAQPRERHPDEPFSLNDVRYDILLPGAVREALNALLDGHPPRVLMISGPQDSAVDEVYPSIERLLRDRSDTTVAPIDVPPMGTAHGVRALVETIARAGGLETNSMPSSYEDEPLPRAIVHLANWLLSGLERQDHHVLFVVRGFEHVFRRDLTDFISIWIEEIARSKGLVHVILLNYAERLSKDAEAQVRRVRLEPVSPSDVSSFFEALFEASGHPYRADAVTQATQRVLAGFQSGWDYQELRRRLKDAARALFGESEST